MVYVLEIYSTPQAGIFKWPYKYGNHFGIYLECQTWYQKQQHQIIQICCLSRQLERNI